MACMESVSVKCTNKLCDYEGYTLNVIGKIFERTVCPKCGFKTLDKTASAFAGLENNEAMLKALEELKR